MFDLVVLDFFPFTLEFNKRSNKYPRMRRFSFNDQRNDGFISSSTTFFAVLPEVRSSLVLLVIRL